MEESPLPTVDVMLIIEMHSHLNYSSFYFLLLVSIMFLSEKEAFSTFFSTSSCIHRQIGSLQTDVLFLKEYRGKTYKFEQDSFIAFQLTVVEHTLFLKS